MKIDYFNDGATPKSDKSAWFASITGLNPILNGGPPSYMFDWNIDKDRFVGKGGSFRDHWFTLGCQIFAIVVNLLAPNQTQNAPREVIKSVIRSQKDPQEVVYDMGVQPWFFFDFNIESCGNNRRPTESIC